MVFWGIIKVLTISTTAAVTINENADPDVPHDVGLSLSLISPNRRESATERATRRPTPKQASWGLR